MLSQCLPWSQIEAALAPAFARGERMGQPREDVDLFGATTQTVGAGISAAGRPRLTIRLMSALLYLKHTFNLSDEDLVERWAENVVWQYFSGQALRATTAVRCYAGRAFSQRDWRSRRGGTAQGQERYGGGDRVGAPQ